MVTLTAYQGLYLLKVSNRNTKNTRERSEMCFNNNDTRATSMTLIWCLYC